MKIASITVELEWNPTEVQTWLDNNPNVVLDFVVVKDNLVYIFYH